jgi:hypothetical protein
MMSCPSCHHNTTGNNGDVRHQPRSAGHPGGGIGLKRSMERFRTRQGGVVWPALLGQAVRGGPVLAHGRGGPTWGGGPGLAQAATPDAGGLPAGLPPGRCPGWERPHPRSQRQGPRSRRPAARAPRGAAGRMAPPAPHATLASPARGGVGRGGERGPRARACPGRPPPGAGPAPRRDRQPGGCRPERGWAMGHQEMPGEPRAGGVRRRVALGRRVLPRQPSAGRDDGRGAPRPTPPSRDTRLCPQANRGRAARPVPRRAPVGEDQGVPRAVPRGHAPRLRREPPEPRGASRRPGGARWALALASRPEPSGAWGGACHPVVPRGLVWTVPGGQSPRSPPTAGIVPAGLHGGPRGGGPAP